MKALLDTNVLLLYLVAQVDVTLLQQWKRVTQFTTMDVELLGNLLANVDGFETTPHVLSEASNFCNQAPPHRRAALMDALERVATTHVEAYELASVLATHATFRYLGLTDTALISRSAHTLVITVDSLLASGIQNAGGNVVNFNHVRSPSLLGR